MQMDSHFVKMENVYNNFEEAPQQNNDILSSLPDESFCGFSDLDPNLELSLDLQELIDKAGVQQDGGHEAAHLFPELALTSEDGTCAEQFEEQEELWKVPATPNDESTTNTYDIEDGDLIGSEISTDTIDTSSFLDSSSCISLPSPASPPRAKRGRPRGSGKALAPSKTTHSSSSRRRAVPKDSNEYRDRRDRNNVAVRKSREKAREKQQLTEARLKVLSTKNTELQKKVDLLTKELTVLKGLFANIGTALPKGLDSILK